MGEHGKYYHSMLAIARKKDIVNKASIDEGVKLPSINILPGDRAVLSIDYDFFMAIVKDRGIKIDCYEQDFVGALVYRYLFDNDYIENIGYMTILTKAGYRAIKYGGEYD